MPLTTETPSPRHALLDTYGSADLVRALVDDQTDAVRAVQAAAPQLARVVDAALPRLQAGGRLIYVGAGTSGRLGLLDSVELYPTFSWPPERARAVLAGGTPALFQAVEGAEDDALQGERDLLDLEPQVHDVVLALAASGGTPYVLGAIAAARARGALTVGLANNPGASVLERAELGVLLDSGAELISGSTRLKAGTAQKIALNAISSALMVRLHKVYGNLMVDVKATNAKLRRRALALTVSATGADEDRAAAALEAADGHVKLAILMLLLGLDAASARERLAASQDDLRAALQQR